MEPFI